MAEQENVNLTEDGEKALMALSGGDMRKVADSPFYIPWIKLFLYLSNF